MPERKFQIGDRVEMTDAAKRCNSRVASRLGTVIGYGKKYHWEIKVQRDGCQNADGWHEDAWQLTANSSNDDAGVK